MSQLFGLDCRQRRRRKTLAAALRRGLEPLSTPGDNWPATPSPHVASSPRRESNPRRRLRSAELESVESGRWGTRRESDPPPLIHSQPSSPDEYAHHSQGPRIELGLPAPETGVQPVTLGPGAETRDRTAFSPASAARYHQTSSLCVRGTGVEPVSSV